MSFSDLAIDFVQIASERVDGLQIGEISPSTIVDRFSSHFGVTPLHCAYVWNYVKHDAMAMDCYVEKKHLLWTLNLCKCDSSEHVLQGRWNATEKTIRKWINIFLKALSELDVVCIIDSFILLLCKF